MSDFLQDAERFFFKYRQIADEVPLQVYSAGLIFALEGSIVREKFKSEIPTWMCQLPKVKGSRSAELQRLEGHSVSVTSVAFSPDGRLLASASQDQTVRLWDTATGALQHALEGHSDGVCSVAFSPNGRLLASASEDKTIQLWDLATGMLQQKLEGHSDWVHSVAFSPDSRLLASASADKTIRLWDPAIGALQQTLECTALYQLLRTPTEARCRPPKSYVYLCRAYCFLKMDSELPKASCPTHYHSRRGAAHVAAS